MESKLSVIIPTFNRRVLAERAVRSVLTQVDPIGTEVIVADDGSPDGTVEQLRTVFAAVVATGRLRIESFVPSGDPGTNRNRGAALARGEYLAFLDDDDWWKPGRLEWLAPLLGRYELVLATDNDLPDIEPMPALLDQNYAITSSCVMTRKLFNDTGGFPTGYYGQTHRIRGWEDYELWLRALVILNDTQRIAQVLLTRNRHVVSEPQFGGAGRVTVRKQMLREAATLLRVSSSIPARYYPKIARRLLGAVKAVLVG